MRVLGLVAVLWPMTGMAEILNGRVLDSREQPLPGAIVEAIDAARGGDPARTRCDDEGRFRIELAPGTYFLLVSAKLHATATEVIEIPQASPIVIRVGAEETETYTVKSPRPRQAPVERVIEAEEVARMPGAFGDPLRVVQDLPGAARAPHGAAALILRGASPRDSKVFLDGVEIPYLFHFGALTSTYNGDMLSAIRFLPGGFGVRYGRSRAGIVEVESRPPPKDRGHGSLDVSVVDATATLRGPLGANTAAAGAVRRSYIDAILAAALPESEETDLTVAPRYYDYQLRADWAPPGGQSVFSLTAFGADDRLEFVREEPRVLVPDDRDNFAHRALFHRFAGHAHLAPRRDTTIRITPYLGLDQTSVLFGENQAVQRRTVFGLRHELSLERESSSWRFGLDLFGSTTRFETNLSVSLLAGSDDPAAEDGGRLSGTTTSPALQLAGYLELAQRWRPWLTTISGVRVDGFQNTGEIVVDPRLTIREQIDERTTLYQSVGAYHQAPSEAEVDPLLGSPNLRSSWSLQSSVGIERDLPLGFRADMTVFANSASGLAMPADEDRSPSIGRELFSPQLGLLGRQTNDGQGRAYGMELLVRRSARHRVHGWVAYTLMRSERQERADEPYALYIFDQPHLLTVVATARLPRGWQIGTRFRWISGNPITPVTDSYFDADRGRYLRVYGEPFSERLPSFHQLDLRVDKTWKFASWGLDVYLEVQNVYYHANVEGVSYNFDATERAFVTGLPILPSLGVRGWF